MKDNQLTTYRQLLMRSFNSNERDCLFCYGNPESYIVRGSPKEHNFHLPFNKDFVDKIVITYTQCGSIVLQKIFDKDKLIDNFREYSFSKGVLYWTLDEDDTLRFIPGEDVKIQLKAGFSDNKKVITSEVYTISVYDTLTPTNFFKENSVLYTIDGRINTQDVYLRQYFDLVQYSDQLYRLRFFFDNSWAGFAKTCRFKDEYNHYIDVDLIETRDDLYECTLPTILLDNPGYIYIGLSGYYTDGESEIVKPTKWSRSLRVEKGDISMKDRETMRNKKTSHYIYYGVVNDAYKAKREDLSLLNITRQELLANGFKWSKYKLDDQYQVVAVPKSLKIKCDKIIQESFSVIPTTHEDDDYIYYYFSSKATGVFTTQYYFKEVS